MELLGNLNFTITYHPGYKLLQANALYRIYVQQVQFKGKIDLDWPMQYPHIKNNYYTPKSSIKTLKKLIKNKIKLTVNQETVFNKIENELQAVFIPIIQYVETVLKYYCNLDHTCSQKLNVF